MPVVCTETITETWNAKSLKAEEKLSILISEMQNINVLGISKAHWQKGLPQAFEYVYYLIFNSSRHDNIYRQGIAVVLSNNFSPYKVVYNLHCERMMSVTTDRRNNPLTIFKYVHLTLFITKAQ